MVVEVEVEMEVGGEEGEGFRLPWHFIGTEATGGVRVRRRPLLVLHHTASARIIEIEIEMV